MNSNKNQNEVSQQIKNAVIDLLHENEEVTHEAIARVTGLSLTEIEKHRTSIQAMLTKLKKAHITPNFKP